MAALTKIDQCKSLNKKIKKNNFSTPFIVMEFLHYIPKLSKIGFAIMHKIEAPNKKIYEILKTSREKMNVTFTPVGKHRIKCIR